MLIGSLVSPSWFLPCAFATQCVFQYPPFNEVSCITRCLAGYLSPQTSQGIQSKCGYFIDLRSKIDFQRKVMIGMVQESRSRFSQKFLTANNKTPLLWFTYPSMVPRLHNACLVWSEDQGLETGRVPQYDCTFPSWPINHALRLGDAQRSHPFLPGHQLR